MSTQVTVATVITRMTAGAGGVALRGALALDPDRYRVTVFAGGADLSGRHGGSGREVLTGPDALRDAPAGDLLAEAYSAGLEVVRVPALVPQISPRLDHSAVRVLTERFQRGRFDVVHTHSTKAGAVGRVAAVRAGVGRVVHTYHGFPFHQFQSAARRTAYIAVERWLARRTDAFLAVGSGVAAEAMRLGMTEPERIRTIPPAVDLTPTAQPLAARRQARIQLGLPPGVRLVGTVGRVDYQKAPEHWADAFAEAATAPDGQDIWGVWIGDGPLRGKLLQRLEKRGVASRFLLTGLRNDVAQLLPALDVFALASRYEGLPCALVEAIGAGVPVVATAVNAVPDLVVPGDTGLLVPAQRPRMLARAMSYLLDNRVEALRMAGNARDRVGDRYSPGVLGSVMEQAYQKRTI